jgi:hypothetical protein
MTNSQVIEDLDEELNTCEAQINEIAQLRPDLILAQLQQGVRASKQELKTLATYLESLQHHRDLIARARAGSRLGFNRASASRPA